MIDKFVDAFMSRREELKRAFSEEHPSNYQDIVEHVINIIADEDEYERPDASRIHEIDDGDYQGTLLYIIGAADYQPSTYWAVRISYGSCSACDTLQRIRGWDGADPTDQQVKDYMTLALHIVQNIKEI